MDAISATLATRRDDVKASTPIPEHGPVTELGEPSPGMAEKMRRRFRSRATGIHAFWGLVFGYVVLHPVAMATFRWFEVRGKAGGWQPVLERAVESFSLEMLPMGLVFAAFSLVIGAMDGYYRTVVHFQRDDLARQLDITQAYRRELEVQNAELRELEKMKRRMTQFLVHDLKNHVGCVLGFTRLLLKRAGKNGWSEKDQDALTAVSRQATRMESAVKDVLELARLEHHPELELRGCPAVAVLREAMMASAIGPGEGTVLLDADVAPNLDVDCDPALIVRVLANLVVNAVRHNGEDVIVTLGAHGGPRSVVLTCSDTGHGIPDEVRDRLFDEFTSSTREVGTAPSYGLGLAFCKAAVEAHGGRIWFESEKTTGTTFLVSIPKKGVDSNHGDTLNLGA